MCICHCDQCRLELRYPFGRVHCRIFLMKSTYCEECQESKQVEQSLSFCSLECANKWMKENELKWKE